MKRELPDGWRWSTIEDVCKTKPRSGGTPLTSNSNYYGGNIPWVITEDLTNAGMYISQTQKKITIEGLENSNAQYFPKDTILFAMYGSIGRMSIATIELTTNQAILGIIPNREQVITKYLYYYLTFVKEIFIEKGRGGTQSNINAGMLCNFPIIVPPLTQQQKIADKLDKQMAQIEIMKKETKKQLDAVLTILESSLSYYLNEKNIFTGTILKFSEICILDKNQINPKSNEAMRLRYVGMEDIESNTGKITLNESIKWDSISSNTFYFNQNHVLYGKLRPYLNKVAEPYFEGRCSTELIPISPKSSCKRDYLAMLLRSSQTIQAAMKNKTGSRMPRADMNEIMKLKIKLPDMNEQESILQKMKLFTSQLDEIRSTINIQLNAINQLPASILNEVFGQYQINN